MLSLVCIRISPPIPLIQYGETGLIRDNPSAEQGYIVDNRNLISYSPFAITGTGRKFRSNDAQNHIFHTWWYTNAQL